MAAEIVAGVAADGASSFADTVFAFLPGVTEQYSRDIVAANPAAIVVSADGAGYRLADDFDPAATLTVPPPPVPPPAGTPVVAAADLLAVLLRYHASELVPSRLASAARAPGRQGARPARADRRRPLAGTAGARPCDGADGLRTH